MSAPESPARPYATLLAKGEDRKQRILAIAERLLARNGWRNTSLAQIAKEAGVSPAGLLHHFESKEQLLNAVLDARDDDDDMHADRSGDLVTEICRVAERFHRAPELVGTFTVLLVENIAPDAPLHDRLQKRQRDAVDIVAELIGSGQRSGRYRHRLRRGHQGRRDPRLRQWNGDRMVARSFDSPGRRVQGVRRVARQGLRPGDAGDRGNDVGRGTDMRYRLDVVAPSVPEVVKFAGGWLVDRVMAGWDVTVLISAGEDTCGAGDPRCGDPRPGVGARDVGGPPAPADRRGGRRSVRQRSAGAPGRAQRARPRADRGDAVGRAVPRGTRRHRRLGAPPPERGCPRVQGSGARGDSTTRTASSSARARRSAAGSWPAHRSPPT